MAKKPTIVSVTSGYNSTTTINQNFDSVRTAFDNTLSRDGSTPNAMNADLDMNSNDILNIHDLDITGTLTVNGTDINDLLAGLGEGEVYAVTNRYTGDGVTSAFTLTVAPVAKANTFAYINGIYQQKSAYSVSGTTLTFDSAPPVGSNNIEIITLTAVEGVAVDASAVTSDVNGNVQADLDELYSRYDGTYSPTFDNVTATGTSTLSTVDINGGAIDGTTIGAATPTTGVFTTLTSKSNNPTFTFTDEDGSSKSTRIRTNNAFNIDKIDDTLFTLVSTMYSIPYDASGATAHIWRTAGTEKARLNATGLGIGTTSPSAALDVVGTAELNGSIKAAGLPTYADNASAISGGLVAGDIYKTAAGELRIVV